MIDTLRWRLTLWSLGFLALSLTLFAALLYVTLSRTMYHHHDDELAFEAAALGAGLRERISAAEASSDAALAEAVDSVRDGAGGSSARYVMLRDASGRLLYRSGSLRALQPSLGLEEMFVHATEETGEKSRFFDAELDAGPTRFICEPVTAGGRQLYLQVGIVLGDVRPMLTSVRNLSWTLIPLVLLVTSFGGFVIARRALRPIARIEATLQAIQATDLSRRIDERGTDRELRQLTVTLNGLLERLERAFASMREFAGDVSHQLQTPLTVMQGTLARVLPETAGSGDGSGEESETVIETETGVGGTAAGTGTWTETATVNDRGSDRDVVLHSLRDNVREMIAIVSALQTLSVADLPARRPGNAPVDLSRMCASVMEAVMALGEAKGVIVEPDIAPGVRVWGDEVRLKQVLLNLGDNAIKFTPPGGRVRIVVDASGQWASLRVTDTGPGVPPEDVTKIFRRFYRAPQPPGAGAAPPGTGLGLAIARRIVDAHGGRIGVECTPGAGAAFTVLLPLADDEPRRA